MSPIQLEIKGDDLAQVVKFSERVADIMAHTKGTADIVSSWEEGKPEVKIEVDREKTARMELTLNIMSMIGIIMLMGLVTKNAILLGDFTNAARARGMAMREALLEAGRIRLRPIVMTTATMIFGMTPLAMALGSGAKIRQGMAIAVIGGLLSSTLLTLVVVPVMYTHVDGWRVKVPALFRRVAWAARVPFKARPAGAIEEPATK